ncbi:MAG TPA: type II toxin-antitoxin system VapC family toxin [Edaphobacter sp.]|nr:type II toxin-antitoxin system VapC family toxin [Edaphobacter sp.]
MTESPRILLDTHAWVWLEQGEERLPLRARNQIERAAWSGSLYIASISLLEIANQYRRGRIQLSIPLEQWFTETLDQRGPQAIPLTPAIALETTLLPDLFHGDPADRIIASTARVEKLTLYTHDKALLHFGKQGLFHTVSI